MPESAVASAFVGTHLVDSFYLNSYGQCSTQIRNTRFELALGERSQEDALVAIQLDRSAYRVSTTLILIWWLRSGLHGRE